MEKRIVNGSGDLNQLAPIKYQWAWQDYLNANKNNWTPLEVPMGPDVYCFKHKLSEDEKHVFTTVLSYLSTSDIIAMRNIGLAVMEKITAPEIQQYLGRQVFEETLHTWTYQHCMETLGLDQTELYSRYLRIPEINVKIQLSNKYLKAACELKSLKDRKDLQDFLHSYFFFAAIFEGTWFYHGFTPIFSMQRRQLMTAASEQLQYIMRDEVMHFGFGLKVIRGIMEEENIDLDIAFIHTMCHEAREAEHIYIKHVLRNPILGYNVDLHMQQFDHILNRRCKQLHVPLPFADVPASIPWLDEQVAINKEKNFFETRVTEYQTGGALKFDDHPADAVAVDPNKPLLEW